MIVHPAIIALLVGSLLASSMLCYASYYGVRILGNWDLKSGSELQLSLERRTYLITTILTYAFLFQLLSLFLFIYTADHLHNLFVGAMCAAGSLHVNEFGYPTIILKVVNSIFAGLWLIVNFTDNQAYDYPLIKKKYVFLLAFTPFVVTETILQANYFLRMDPNIITSCCGSLFTADAEGVTSGVVSLPRIPASLAFYSLMAFTFGLGIYSYVTAKGTFVFSLTTMVTFVACIAALISFISLYFYELPTHHCPFDILQAEYHFVGYPIYVSLLAGVVSGLGAGLVRLCNKIKTLKAVIPGIQRRLTLISLISYGIFMVIASHEVISSNLTLSGY